MNNDILSGLEGFSSGLLGGYERGRDRRTRAEQAKAQAQAEVDKEQRGANLQRELHLLPGPDASKILAKMGYGWDETKGFPVSGLSALSTLEGKKITKPAGGGSKSKWDAGAATVKAQLAAKEALGLDKRLPVPEDALEAFNQQVEANMKSYAEAAGQAYNAAPQIKAPAKKSAWQNFKEGVFGGDGVEAPAAAPATGAWSVTPAK